MSAALLCNEFAKGKQTLGPDVTQSPHFGTAPPQVSIIQPVSGLGLVGLALYSHFALAEHLHPWEWVAVGLAGVGTLGLGATSGGSDGGSGNAVSSARMLAVLAVVGLLVGSMSLLRQRQQRATAKQGRRPDSRSSAAIYGLQAGGCFGLSAASCRVAFLLGQRVWAWIPLGLGGSVVLSSTGFVLQTCGLKEGSTVVVCTLAAVSGESLCSMRGPLPLVID
jgi:hypothetical protein